jgi:hypothetical protein
MSVTFRIGGIAAACIALSVWTSSAAELSRYREFDLGSSVATVTAVTGSTGRDLKTLHSNPALLQDVAWQPRYMSGAPVADRHSINEVMFSFVDDRLFRMTVAYDRSRTTGLTDADMIAALTELYGVPASSPAPSRAAGQTADGVAVLAEWRDANVHVALRRVGYNDSFSLIITSLPLEAIARQAQATARTIDAREAPAREAALAKKRADDQRHAEEQVRATNRKVFRP